MFQFLVLSFLLPKELIYECNKISSIKVQYSDKNSNYEQENEREKMNE